MSQGIVHLAKDLPNLGLKSNDVGVVRQPGPAQCRVFLLTLNEIITLNNSYIVQIDPGQYGDGFDEKICNVCHRILPTTDFDKNQNGKDNRTVRRPSCKDCRVDIDGVAMNSAEKRRWVAKKPHQVDFECPICKKITIAGVTSKVVLNHDHDTGRILGWICDSCNTGLGRFKDDIAILQEAIKYLETH